MGESRSLLKDMQTKTVADEGLSGSDVFISISCNQDKDKKAFKTLKGSLI